MTAATRTSHGLRISLKMLLILLLAVGAGIGLLGRLFLSNPQVFFAVVGGLSTIVPFLLAISTIFVLGFRGKRQGLMLWSGLLILMPIIGISVIFFGQRFVGSSPSNLAVQNTQMLIEEQLRKRVNEPWVWNELERRVTTGSLTAEQADEAVGVFIAHMKSSKPEGWDQPLHWQDEFLKAATQAGLISDPVMYELCDAFYGPKPVIRPLPRLRAGDSGFDITIKYGSTWSNNSGLDLQLVWDVNQVLVDDKPVEAKRSHRSRDSWHGQCKGDLTAGEHKIAVEVEAAYIDNKKLIGLSTHDLPKKNWPIAAKRWKQTVSIPMRVFTVDEPIVGLTTDPSLDPTKSRAIKVKRLVAQVYPRGGIQLILQFDYGPTDLVPLSNDVTVKAGRETYQIGSQWVIRTGNSMSRGGSLRKRIESLDPSVRTCDIILTPNPKHIEQRPEVKAIWGETITILNVPIERLDLEAGQEAEPSTNGSKSSE